MSFIYINLSQRLTICAINTVPDLDKHNDNAITIVRENNDKYVVSVI